MGERERKIELSRTVYGQLFSQRQMENERAKFEKNGFWRVGCKSKVQVKRMRECEFYKLSVFVFV